jgi:hypothetical protein
MSWLLAMKLATFNGRNISLVIKENNGVIAECCCLL